MNLGTNANNAISVSEDNLRKLINNTDDPIWLVDNNYVIIECNNAFKKWVHHFIGQELHTGDNVLFEGRNESYSQKFETCYHLALSGSSFKSVEDLLIDNVVVYTAVSFNPVFNAANEVTGVSCFASDITEQRKHLHHIEKQNQALKEIAFMESHKLRGPLANIIGLQDLFNYNNLSDPLNKELMEAISVMSLELDKIVIEVVRKTNEI